MFKYLALVAAAAALRLAGACPDGQVAKGGKCVDGFAEPVNKTAAFNAGATNATAAFGEPAKNATAAFGDATNKTAAFDAPKNAHAFINYILRPEVHASLTNAVFYANPNAASKPFVDKTVANNPTVFLSAEDMKKMTPPDSVPQDIRRIQTRIFTAYRAGVK